jgi:hypothetical protein
VTATSRGALETSTPTSKSLIRRELALRVRPVPESSALHLTAAYTSAAQPVRALTPSYFFCDGESVTNAL